MYATQQSPGSPSYRSPMQRRRTHASKEQQTREEKVYREIMGGEGIVKQQYQHWLINLEIDSDDLIDKKLQDFVKENERKVHPEVLQTRYDFFHNKRFYKLGELVKIREQARAIEQAKAYERQQIEREQRKIASSKRGEADKSAAGGDVVVSQLGGRSNMMNKKPSSMQVPTVDYGALIGNKANRGGVLPQVNRKESNSRLAEQSRMKGASRHNVQQTPPRLSSMNVREAMESGARNKPTGFFMTQADTTQSVPRTGAHGYRDKNMAPLLSPAHQRMVNVNASQAFNPGDSPTTPNALEIDKERSKIARFLETKQRSGQMFQAREGRIEARLKEMDKKQKDFEKKKRVERKQALAKLGEHQSEWNERRNKVYEHKLELENKSVQEYRRAVAASKRAMKQQLTTSQVQQNSLEARNELQAKSAQREEQNSTFQVMDRNSRLETIRTLETVESKVGAHREKAQMHKRGLSQKISKDYERVFYQKTKHQEDQERSEMEKEAELLEKINKRKEAVKKYEKAKRKASIKMGEKNFEKMEMTQKCEEKREEDKKNMARQLRQKELVIKRKMREVEEKNLADQEVKKERQRLIVEDAQKRKEFQKRNMNFKKLEVLDKHQRIGDLCTQINSNKKQFIESSRIANEIRVQKMGTVGSPPKGKFVKSPTKAGIEGAAQII